VRAYCCTPLRVSLAPLPLLSLEAKRATLAPIKKDILATEHLNDLHARHQHLIVTGRVFLLPTQRCDPRQRKPLASLAGFRCGGGGTAMLMIATPPLALVGTSFC